MYYEIRKLNGQKGITVLPNPMLPEEIIRIKRGKQGIVNRISLRIPWKIKAFFAEIPIGTLYYSNTGISWIIRCCHL